MERITAECLREVNVTVAQTLEPELLSSSTSTFLLHSFLGAHLPSASRQETLPSTCTFLNGT